MSEIFDEIVEVCESLEGLDEAIMKHAHALEDFEKRLTQVEKTLSFLAHLFYARYPHKKADSYEPAREVIR